MNGISTFIRPSDRAGSGVNFSELLCLAMGMNDIGAGEEVVVVENRGRCAGGDELAILKDKTAFGDFHNRVEVMGGGDNGLACTSPTGQEIKHGSLALGVKGRGGLIKQ